MVFDKFKKFIEETTGKDVQKIINKAVDTSLDKLEKGVNNLNDKAQELSKKFDDSNKEVKIAPIKTIEHRNLVDTDGMNAVPRDEYGNVDRRKIPAEEIDRMQQIEASEKYRCKIYKMFYKGYPEMPFISQDREFNTNWIEQAQMFPEQSILKKSKMIRFSDGLLPGHIYMLYWLGKYANRRIPAYFEYDYGIHFVVEKDFLKKHGYLNDIDKPTGLGRQAIEVHYDIIEERHPKPLHTSETPVGFTDTEAPARIIPNNITPGIIDIPNSDMNLIRKEFSIINSLVSEAISLARLNLKLKIDFSLLRFEKNFTYYEYAPYTKTGRSSKYPLTLHYAYDKHGQPIPPRDYFGELKYLSSGKIGTARLIFWNHTDGYMISLGTVKNMLAIKKVERSVSSGWQVVYKIES